MTRVLIRNSERSSFKTCRFRWAVTFGGVWANIGPLQSREPAKALWFGDLVHQALAAYYKPGMKRGPAPAKTFIRLYDADERLGAVQRNDEGEWESIRDLGRGMMEGYVERFRAADEEWEVLASEQTFQLPVRVNGRTLFWVVGTFDGLWRSRVERDRVAFKEFKTASQISTDGLNMDEQASFYWTYGPRWTWKAGILPAEVYPSEILYTFLRKAIRNPDFGWDDQGRRLNKDGSISKQQPAPFFERLPMYRDEHERIQTHQRVLEEFADMELVRLNPAKAYKNPGPLHMPNCRGCPIRDACELHETGHDWMTMLTQTTQPWEPYAAHELIERR